MGTIRRVAFVGAFLAALVVSLQGQQQPQPPGE